MYDKEKEAAFKNRKEYKEAEKRTRFVTERPLQENRSCLPHYCQNREWRYTRPENQYGKKDCGSSWGNS
ncbi:MAG: hypothetical protein UT84_C0012G0004 [Candidatus Curtissbacteria bacterium GW2011_GWA1_40_16]|uniref:Uncharacterized protein n=1 Tax=Candidatus Curtissbacteria bacterium GW2011_GWA1_40_16 TaxID=1618405 RepID=A0A0G0RK94_9BACT|nr:MAG: hypothetical protein UT84_C0012G0004 [Candidatus Curtissbacteria bacterium GW2011_GWA1_40_16]